MATVMIVIPARYHSSRFPGKPLALLRGKPLISWVVERCQQARNAARVLVATDDQRIMDQVVTNGAEAEFTSPHHQSGSERVAEVASRHQEITWFINVQGDEPDIDPELIDQLIKKLIELDDPTTIVTARCPIKNKVDFRSPNVVKVVADFTGRALYFSRAPIPSSIDTNNGRKNFTAGNCWQHVGIYGYHRSFLQKLATMQPGALEQNEQLEQLRWLENGYQIQLLDIARPSIGVDTPEELIQLEKKWQQLTVKPG